MGNSSKQSCTLSYWLLISEENPATCLVYPVPHRWPFLSVHILQFICIFYCLGIYIPPKNVKKWGFGRYVTGFMIKEMPGKGSSRKDSFWLTVPRFSPSWQGSPGNRRLRPVITSSMRQRKKNVCVQFTFSFSFGPFPHLWNGNHLGWASQPQQAYST